MPDEVIVKARYNLGEALKHALGCEHLHKLVEDPEFTARCLLAMQRPGVLNSEASQAFLEAFMAGLIVPSLMTGLQAAWDASEPPSPAFLQTCSYMIASAWIAGATMALVSHDAEFFEAEPVSHVPPGSTIH